MENVDNLKNEGEKLQDNNENISEHSLDEIQEVTNKLSSLTRQKAEEIRLEISLEDSELLEELEVVLREEQKLKSKLDAQLKIEYDNLLRQPMPIIGTAEYGERQKAVMNNINIKSKEIGLDEFTYFEEVEEYINKNILFTEDDRTNANIALNDIKKKNPEIKINISKYINEINSNKKTKNLFRSYLMIKKFIGQKETNITNSLNKVSFDNVFIKSKNISDIFSLDVFKNKDIQEYLKQDFDPEEYKKYYKEFTEQKLLAENKNNIKKYIKIQTIINSQKWEEIWNNIA